MKQPRYFFMLAGDTIIDMFTQYAMTTEYSDNNDNHKLEDFQDEMEKSRFGSVDFDICEAEAKDYMKDAEVPFAIVFKNTKLYALITKDSTKFFEVL
jgi:hypothetical protein